VTEHHSRARCVARGNVEVGTSRVRRTICGGARVLNLYMYTTLEYVNRAIGMDTVISKHWSIYIDK
jgi:hypothetical protein